MQKTKPITPDLLLQTLIKFGVNNIRYTKVTDTIIVANLRITKKQLELNRNILKNHGKINYLKSRLSGGVETIYKL